jgi:hypothetical protein
MEPGEEISLYDFGDILNSFSPIIILLYIHTTDIHVR